MIKVILWDVDGTLLDFEMAEKEAIRKCFEVFEPKIILLIFVLIVNSNIISIHTFNVGNKTKMFFGFLDKGKHFKIFKPSVNKFAAYWVRLHSGNDAWERSLFSVFCHAGNNFFFSFAYNMNK